MTLNIVQADISIRNLMRWSGERRHTDTDRAMHCLLIETFGQDAPRPYRAIIPRRGRSGTLYGYTTKSTDDLLRMQAMYANPAQIRILPPDSFIDKEIPQEIWTEGRRIGFEIRVRPVRQLQNQEHDAYIRHLKKHPESLRTREEVYTDWLIQRLERGGATLEGGSARMSNYRRCQMYRQQSGPDAVMHGNLTVTDPDAFEQMIKTGIGRHRTFGYGMLLPRPPIRA